MGTVLSDPQMETPAYLYDLATVRRAHRQLTHSLPESVGLLYSLKANPGTTADRYWRFIDVGFRRDND
jgi:diaminopimelate decarboxylase